MRRPRRLYRLSILPPYVPAKSSDLKNISGSSNDKISGGINVKMNGKGLLSPVGSFSTGCAEKTIYQILKQSLYIQDQEIYNIKHMCYPQFHI